MSKVLVIGCGGVASVAISKCCQVSDVFTELCIASRTKSKCDALAAKLAPNTKTKITTAQVDADKLKYPLTVRRWQEGDWFIPYGMSGRKKVSDYLIDHKVPLPEKARQFVLLSGDEIVWLVGRRIDDRYRLTAETENVLRITKEII